MNDLIARIATALTAIVAALGYPGITLLMALGSACVPLPSEAVMPFAGYLVSQGNFTLFGAALAGTVGVGIGSSIAYAIGRRGGRPLVERYGRFVLLSPGDLDKAERFFARWGAAAVLFGQMVPLVRAFIAFPAGMARMTYPRFILCALAGAGPWCLLHVWIGLKLGRAWNSDPRIARVFHSLDVVIVAVVLIAGVWYLRHKLKRR